MGEMWFFDCQFGQDYKHKSSMKQLRGGHRGRPRLNSKYRMRVSVKTQTSRKVCYFVHILAHKVH